MTAIRRTSMLGLAVLLMATTAAADTVITADEVISGSVVSASADSIRLRLTRRRDRTLSAWEVYEVRVSDAARVAELAALLPQAEVMLDSGQLVPSPEIRILEAMQSRLDRAREARTQGVPWPADVVDTLALGSSLPRMATRCLEMDAVLRRCGYSDDTVAELLGEVRHEADGLRRFHPGVATCLVVPSVGLLGAVGGALIGGSAVQPQRGSFDPCAGCGEVLIGSVAGLTFGSLVGLRVSHDWRASRIARHRARVNDLIGRVNRVVASAP